MIDFKDILLFGRRQGVLGKTNSSHRGPHSEGTAEPGRVCWTGGHTNTSLTARLVPGSSQNKQAWAAPGPHCLAHSFPPRDRAELAHPFSSGLSHGSRLRLSDRTRNEEGSAPSSDCRQQLCLQEVMRDGVAPRGWQCTRVPLPW